MHPVANSATLSCHRPHGASGRTAGWSLAAMQHCSAHTAHAQRLAGSFQLDRCATCAAVPHGCNNSSSSTGSSGQQAKNPGTSSTGSSRQAPWAFAAYYTKKLERRTDALGNIVQDSSTIAEPLNWTADARLALAVKVRVHRSDAVLAPRLPRWPRDHAVRDPLCAHVAMPQGLPNL